MASTSTYLNFEGNTEEVFTFYRSVFGTEFTGPIARMGDVPPGPGVPPLSDVEKNYVMHVALPILGGHLLMGTDSLPHFGKLTFGNNFNLSLEPDSLDEARRLFAALSEGGKVQMPLTYMPWGAWWGSFTDRYGVGWMINRPESPPA